jgi:hypothetical protein
MPKIISVLIAVTIMGVIPAPVFAQTDEGATMSAPAVSIGNTVIEAGGASPADLPMQRYKAWDEFQASHPKIARELRRRPELINSSRFLASHPDLKEFFDAHPDIREDMASNPGNYVVLVPGAEARVRARHQSASR